MTKKSGGFRSLRNQEKRATSQRQYKGAFEAILKGCQGGGMCIGIQPSIPGSLIRQKGVMMGLAKAINMGE